MSDFPRTAEEGARYETMLGLEKIAEGLMAIAEAIGDHAEAANRQAAATETLATNVGACATHLKYLGVGDAATTMGAIEGLMVATQEVASAIRQAGEAIAETGS